MLETSDKPNRQRDRSADALLQEPFGTISDLIRAHAVERPDHVALELDDEQLSYSELDELVDRIGASLQKTGVRKGDTVAFCVAASLAPVAAFFAVLRIGGVAVPLPMMAAGADLAGMLLDSRARLVFVDRTGAEKLNQAGSISASAVEQVSIDDESAPICLARWMAPRGDRPTSIEVNPDDPINIIYSSGTTGTPKGIVQPQSQRWVGMTERVKPYKLDKVSVTLIPTPLYSNLTIFILMATLAHGGTAVLMAKFDARGFLQLAEQVRATHTMLVTVPLQRMLNVPDFDKFDLSSFKMKIFGGAPCAPELKLELLQRWPGDLIELFGMTEGGASTMLFCREYPHKLHTIGLPLEHHDVRIIKEDGSEAAPGEIGEIVGRSRGMMIGYHNHLELTRKAEWFDVTGKRFIRTGDLGAFDQDGFLILKGREKDMIISGGFNVYPTDIEAVLRKHDAVAEAAVVGVPCERWGETPVGFVTLGSGATANAEQIRLWANARLGKTQRLSALEVVDSFPRNAIDKVLKRDLRPRAIAAYEAASSLGV